LISGGVFVLGTDIRNQVAGEAFVDMFAVIPPAVEEMAWLQCVERLCSEHDLVAIIPGCEPEMHLLARSFPQGYGPHGTVSVAQSGSWFERYGDKLLCMNALAGCVQLAPYADGSDQAAVLELASVSGYPLVVKPRRASGSVSFSIVQNEVELLDAIGRCPAPLVQDYIDEDEGEFSVGLFSCATFSTVVAFRRQLGYGGASWYADNLDQDVEVLEYCRAVAEASGLQGSCNVQVRKSSRGVRLLEINPRFSSLVAARAACGFRDLEWSLKMALKTPFSTPPDSYRSLRFQRFVHEVIDFGCGYGELDAWRPRSTPYKESCKERVMEVGETSNCKTRLIETDKV
jgi:carbamoyl-phosphate synthase large subunit